MNAENMSLEYANQALRKERQDLKDENEKLKKELDIEKQCRQGNVWSVVDTVKGIVDGEPTTPDNFLQRLRELVSIEKEFLKLKENIDLYHDEIVDANFHIEKFSEEISNSLKKVRDCLKAGHGRAASQMN